MKRIVSILFPALLSGCVGGPPNEFYTPGRYKPWYTPKDEPHVMVVEDAAAEVKRLRNYIMIGSSDWTGRLPKHNEIISQAKRVRADVVVYEAKHMGTVSGQATQLVPNPDGVATATTFSPSGTSTTILTVPGGYSQYSVPYVTERYTVHLIFMGQYGRTNWYE